MGQALRHCNLQLCRRLARSTRLEGWHSSPTDNKELSPCFSFIWPCHALTQHAIGAIHHTQDMEPTLSITWPPQDKDAFLGALQRG